MDVFSLILPRFQAAQRPHSSAWWSDGLARVGVGLGPVPFHKHISSGTRLAAILEVKTAIHGINKSIHENSHPVNTYIN